MDIKINYNKLVKSGNKDGKETSIDYAIKKSEELCLQDKLPQDGVERFKNFLLEMQQRGMNTVEQVLKQFLADYLTNGRVGDNEYADKKYVEEQFFKFSEAYLQNVYCVSMTHGINHFPNSAQIKVDYDWGAILDLIDPEVLKDKSLYTTAKYHLEDYLFFELGGKTYDKEINTRMPEITFDDFAHYYFLNKKKAENEAQ